MAGSQHTCRVSSMFRKHYVAAIALFVMMASSLSAVSWFHAQEINYVNATFSVEYNNQPSQGEQRLRIQRDQTTYQLEFVLDHWLVSSTQRATFKMEQCQVQPISYSSTHTRPFRSETRETLEFDWEHRKAEYRSGDEEKTFSLDQPYYDPVSFFFEARCGLMAGKTDFTYPLIRKGDTRRQTYKVVGTEMIKTGLGDVQALVVERQRSSETRKTRLYVAPELGYLLVRLEHQENRLARIVATLSDMDYELAATP